MSLLNISSQKKKNYFCTNQIKDMKDLITCYSVWCCKIVFWMKSFGMKYYFIKEFNKLKEGRKDLGGSVRSFYVSI